MKTNSILLKSVFLLLFFYGYNLNSSLANIPKMDFAKARDMAVKQNRLLVVSFVADWCEPCNWMKKKIDKNEKIADLTSKYLVQVDVNIDEIDGFNLKNEYGIQKLPTTLIFDRTGKLVERLEKTMSDTDLANLLQTLVDKSYGDQLREKTYQVNTSPNKSGKERLVTATVKTFFRLQLGSFEQYANVHEFLNKMRALLDEPIVVEQQFVTDHVVYRLLWGAFESKEEALKSRQTLVSKYKLEAVVVER